MNGFFFDVKPAHIAHASHTHRTHIAHTHTPHACACACAAPSQHCATTLCVLAAHLKKWDFNARYWWYLNMGVHLVFTLQVTYLAAPSALDPCTRAMRPVGLM